MQQYSNVCKQKSQENKAKQQTPATPSESLDVGWLSSGEFNCLELEYSNPRSNNCRTHNILWNELETKKKAYSTDDNYNNDNNYSRGSGIFCRLVNEANQSIDFSSNISANISKV
ncbi:unnamed protein product [Trichobilharzia regenti]|nr:unnamed protein product [Trichobilharzia regenti]